MRNIELPKFVYVGRRWCGCAVAVVADMSDVRAFVAESVKDFILDGLDVTREPLPFDNLVLKCPHGDPPRPDGQLELFKE